jgi:hypothetical protein
MSDHEYEPAGTALRPAEQAKGRRALVGYSILFLGIAFAGFAGVRPLRWLGFLAVTIGATLTLSRPKGTGRALTPSNIHRIARCAAVSEVGATIVVYGCLVAGLTGAITNFATN